MLRLSSLFPFCSLYHLQTRFIKRRITLPKALLVLPLLIEAPFTFRWGMDESIAPLLERGEEKGCEFFHPLFQPIEA
jgi:hypothetical protein